MSAKNLAGSGTLHIRLAARTAGDRGFGWRVFFQSNVRVHFSEICKAVWEQASLEHLVHGARDLGHRAPASNLPSLRAGMSQASPTTNLHLPLSIPAGTLATFSSMISPSTSLMYFLLPVAYAPNPTKVRSTRFYFPPCFPSPCSLGNCNHWLPKRVVVPPALSWLSYAPTPSFATMYACLTWRNGVKAHLHAVGSIDESSGKVESDNLLKVPGHLEGSATNGAPNVQAAALLGGARRALPGAQLQVENTVVRVGGWVSG